MSFPGEAVRRTPEFVRIANLPWRDPHEIPDRHVRALTEIFRTGKPCAKCGGLYEHVPTVTGKPCEWLMKLPLKLRPKQAQALADCYRNGGLIGPIGTGQGKTLLTLLMTGMVNGLDSTAARAGSMLLVPSNLEGKTRHDWEFLAPYWRISPSLQIMGYGLLSTIGGKREIERIPPRLLQLDEASNLANPTAARTIRVDRFVKARRQAGEPLIVAAYSGTFMSDSLWDMAHIVGWCLPKQRPIPVHYPEIDAWARAIDACVTPLNRTDPGPLLEFLGSVERAEPLDPVTAARKGFRRRFIGTPGVVATEETILGNGLEIDVFEMPTDAAIEEAFRQLRDEWTLPDGHQDVDGMDNARHAKTLALGYVDVWDPWPPEEWLLARRDWLRVVRDVISQGDYDSKADVERAFPNHPALVHWRKIKPTFQANSRPVWVSESPLNAVAAWLHAEPCGIAWVSGRPFGYRLAELSGFRYYADGGLATSDGSRIEDGDGPIIASVNANAEGRNLQFKWHKNLICTPSASGRRTEQLLARTHRIGQQATTVTASVGFGCLENWRSFWTSYEKACMLQDTLGPQKLLSATILVPQEKPIRPSWAWRKTTKKEQ